MKLRFAWLGFMLMPLLGLGLLLCIAPPSTRAQQGGGNSGSQQENTNCPNYTTNVTVSCPSITDNGTIAPTSFCLSKGDSVPDPTLVTNPVASIGGVITTITETCSNTVTSSTNTVTYSFGSMYCNPAKPNGTTVGTFTNTYYIPVTSSDTNDCPSPGPLALGSVTWNVVKGAVILNTIPYSWIPDWEANFVNVAGGYLNLPTTIASITGSDNNYYQDYCCGNNSAYVSYDNKIINAGTQSLNVTAGSTSIQSMADTIISDALEAFGYNPPGLSSAVSQYINVNASFSLANLTAAGSANFNNVIGYIDTCNCPGSDNAWFGTDEISLLGSVGTLTVPSSLFLQFGYTNVTCNITVISASLDCKITGQQFYIGPATTTFAVTKSTECKTDIHTHVQLGRFNQNFPWYPATGPSDTTTATTNTVCEGNWYP